MVKTDSSSFTVQDSHMLPEFHSREILLQLGQEVCNLQDTSSSHLTTYPLRPAHV